MSNWTSRTNAIRKTVRTALQVIVAAVPAVIALTVGLPASVAVAILAVATPVATFAQNILEDKGILGTWLRRPTPAPGSIGRP